MALNGTTPLGQPPQTPVSGNIRIVAILLLAVVAGAAAIGWYWLNRPISADALAIEAAVADGSLVAIGHVDVERIVELKTRWFGSDDSGAVPIPEEHKALLEKLFAGDANFTDNLEHLIFAINVLAEETRVEPTLILAGRFDEAAIRTTLAAEYQLESLGNGLWSMVRAPKQAEGRSCPEPESARPRPVAKPHYLHITPQRLLISGSDAQARHMEQRLVSGDPAAQELEAWRAYRRGQLASFMVFIPADASRAVDGLPGMVARKAATDTPHISQIAARVGLAPLSAGLHADVSLTSSDAGWISEKAAKLRQGLEQWSQDSRNVSPSLGRLVSRISVADTPDTLQIDVGVDGEMLSEIGQTVQEAIASFFTVKVSDGRRDEGPVVDQIMQHPTDYAANAGLERLPTYEPASYEAHPLFMDGSFAANLESVTRNSEGLFEFKLTGVVPLPKGEFGSFRVGSLTFWIDEVADAEGRSLLRDEHCVEPPRWGKRNHEPVVDTSLFTDKVTVQKWVRLAEGAAPGDAAVISGRLEFSAPVQVRRFALPLTAGGHIEHLGLRFFVNRVGEDGNVSFQISGEKDRFLELRALNQDGKPLQTDWMMGDVENGRLTRHFKGTIHSLEIYVAERYTKQQAAFTLRDLFAAPEKKEQTVRAPWFAPEAIPESAWTQYAALDMKRLHADPKEAEWHGGERQGPPIATLIKAPIALDLTHKVEAWGNNPALRIYYPMIPELPGVLSGLSYRIDEPAREKTGAERYVKIFYPYYHMNGETTVHYNREHQINGKPFVGQQINLIAGLEQNERLERFAGRIRFRLPTRTASTRLPLDELWQGRSVDGVTVTLTALERGMFPGYAMKVEGAVDRLVNLHGISPEGERIMAAPINFQEGGYWTMTLPFTPGMREAELVIATEQKVYDYPFDFKPKYPESQGASPAD